MGQQKPLKIDSIQFDRSTARIFKDLVAEISKLNASLEKLKEHFPPKQNETTDKETDK